MNSNGNKDNYSDEDLEQLLNKLQQMFNNPIFREKVKKLLHKKIKAKEEDPSSININISLNEIKEPSKMKHVKNPRTLDTDFEKDDIPTDIMEKNKHVFVTAQLPGLYKKEDIDLTVYPADLHITANKPNIERRDKHLNLPCFVDTDSYEVEYNNGILDIKLTKRE